MKMFWRKKRDKGIENQLYQSYLIIARGAEPKDLREALRVYSNERSEMETLLLTLFVSAPAHIRAFEKALTEKDKTYRPLYQKS